MPEDQIVCGDIPALSEEQLAGIRRGLFYRPVKQQITSWMDSKELERFEAGGGINCGAVPTANRSLASFAFRLKRMWMKVFRWQSRKDRVSHVGVNLLAKACWQKVQF
ncbi:MAG: hypothetical protein OXI87_23525 [Albidovulum sp.]|nr:hypothetical protein [Albidovulum sp.]MDE0307827.1 hypothetical protein [Albidovulum sp.]MDE0533619.1 hypothetical protein [Albidovulum sp.]